MKLKSTILVVALAISVAANTYLGYSVYLLNNQHREMDSESQLRMAELNGLRQDFARLTSEYDSLQLSYNKINSRDSKLDALETNRIQDPADLVPPSITDTLKPPVVTPPTVKPPVTPPTVKPPTVKPPQKEDSSRPDFGPGWDNLPDFGGTGLETKPGESLKDKDGSYEDTGSGGYQ